MLSDLFRKEALEHRSHKLMGKVIILQPIKNYMITGCVFFIFLFGSIFLANASFSRKVTVEGFITPLNGLVKIYGQKGGTLNNITVMAGQYVKAGEILAFVRLDTLLEGGDNVTKSFLAELRVQETEIEHNLVNIDKNEILVIQNSKNRIVSFIQELHQLDQQYIIQKDRHKNILKQVNILKKLFKKGYTTNREFLNYSEQALSHEQTLYEIKQRSIKLKEVIKQEEKQLSILPINFSKERSSLMMRRSGLKERRTSILSNSGYTLKSPIDGIVSAVQIKKGQTILPSLPIITIIGKDAKLQVELLVPSRAAGFLEEGQEVKLQYDAFPYQQYGIYKGHIKYIHNTLYNPNELVVPISLKEPVYRIIIELEKQEINAYGKSFSLQPGMLVKGDIILNKRTILEWLLNPLMSYGGSV